jgi:hypothetical protein
MNNTQHIQENYKKSTMFRLMEQFNYKTEEEVNADQDITDTLVFLEGHNLQVQDVFFQCLEVVKNFRK